MNRNKNTGRSYATDGNQLVKRAAIVGLTMLLVGCTSNRIVITSDDSVDYKSAKSLPPLIKPEDIEPENLPVAAETSLQVEQSVAQVEEVVAPEPTTEIEPVAETSEDIQPSDSLIPQADEDSSEIETVADLEPQSTQDSQGSAIISSELVSQGSTTRLQINGDWDTAWEYLVNQLNSSGLTVFSRNKTAGRIAIGCGQIGDEVKVTRSGGWSIFNRKSEKATEYCSLQMRDKGDTVLVSVLDRAGNEAPQKEGQSVLSGLATN